MAKFKLLVGLLVLGLGLWVGTGALRAQDEAVDEDTADVTAPVSHDEGALSAEPKKTGKWRKGRAVHRAEMLKKFDADGDGRLSPEERKKAREAGFGRKGRRGKGGKKGRRVRKRWRKAFRSRFDANKDGKLDKDERAAMKAARQKLKADAEMKRLREQVKQARAKLRELVGPRHKRGVRRHKGQKGQKGQKGRKRVHPKRSDEEKAKIKAAREELKKARKALVARRQSLLDELAGGAK